MHGVTRPVTFELEPNGFSKDPFGGYRATCRPRPTSAAATSASASTCPMEGGGVVVGDKVQVSLELEAVLDSPAS